MSKPLFWSGHTIRTKKVVEAMEQKGYEIRSRGNYDLNVVGVRMKKPKIDKFNDVLVAFYPMNGQWQSQKFQITTIPGLTYLSKKLGNSKGTAILIPGQYRDKYEIRDHTSGPTHQALCQKRTEGGGQVSGIKVWRDKTLDGKINPDKSKTFEGTGINIHRSDPKNCLIKIGSWSSGCQVFRCATQFASFMAIVRKARSEWKNSFTYTLIDEDDI